MTIFVRALWLSILCVFLIATHPSLADNRSDPAVGFGADDESNSQVDVHNILSNYVGPALTADALKTSVIIEFSLYPDGSIKWLHQCTQGTNQAPQEISNSLKAALLRSQPLKLALTASSKNPELASLVAAVTKSGEKPSVSLGFADPVSRGEYIFSESKLESEPQWLRENQNKIEKQLILEKSANQIGALWFRLSPDGTPESLTPTSIIFAGKRQPSNQRLTDAIASALQASSLSYGQDQKSDANQGVIGLAPVGILVIYDGRLNVPVQLRLVSRHIAPIVVIQP